MFSETYEYLIHFKVRIMYGFTLCRSELGAPEIVRAHAQHDGYFLCVGGVTKAIFEFFFRLKQKKS